MTLRNVLTISLVASFAFAAVGCSPTNHSPSATTLGIHVATLDGMTTGVPTAFNFVVTDAGGNEVPSKILGCYTNNVCDVSVTLQPLGTGMVHTASVAAYYDGAYVGSGVAKIPGDRIGQDGIRLVKVPSLAHGFKVLRRASVISNDSMWDIATRLAKVWGVAGPDRTADAVALLERIAADSLRERPASLDEAGRFVHALSHSAPIAAASSLRTTTRTANLNEPLPDPSHHWERMSRASSTLEVLGWAANLTKFIYGECEQQGAKGLAGIAKLETQVQGIAATLDTIQGEVQGLTTTVVQNDKLLLVQNLATLLNNVDVRVTTYREPLHQINVKCNGALGNPTVGYIASTSDMENCLKDDTARKSIEILLGSLFDDGTTSAYLSAQLLTKGLTPNASLTSDPASMSGDLLILMQAVYSDTKVLEDYTFSSLWYKGPYEIGVTANLTGATQLMTMLGSMAQYEALGNYLHATYPVEWTDSTLTWALEFPDTTQRLIVQNYFTGLCTDILGEAKSATCSTGAPASASSGAATVRDPQASTNDVVFYRIPGDSSTLVDDLKNSGLVTFLPQTGLTIGNLSTSDAVGTCAILDYDRNNSMITYQCDGLSYSPLRSLRLPHCRGFSGSNATLSTINIWYVNASGKAGDGYLACDDTLVGNKAQASIGGGQTAFFPGYWQHPGATQDTYMGESDYHTGVLNSSVHGEIHLYTINSGGYYPSSILAATPGYGLGWNNADGQALTDGGTNTIYAALVTYMNGDQQGPTFEVMHNYLGMNADFIGANNSEVFIRCPLGFAIDCRPMFSSSSGCTRDNAIVVNGKKLHLSSSSGGGSSCDLSTYGNGWSNNQNILNSSFTGGNAWIYWEDFLGVSLPTLESANLVTGHNLAAWTLIPAAGARVWGTQYFEAGSLSLQLGQAVRVLVSTSMSYQLVLQQDHNLVLYQCTDSACANGFPLWDSKTSGNGSVATAAFTAGGHLVLQDANGNTIWDRFGEWGSTTTPRTPSDTAIFALQDDGNMVIYEKGNLPNPFGNGSVASSGTNIVEWNQHGWSAPPGYQ